ncbi:baseplate J/gp47 family protein [Pigmentiphaga sp. CHJ604]|uniref:baseplate assembly protein n=1 Tax=Pigmentiphaga sp. CHJ604 TaxID=3081984 RepID=UPI0030D18758
MAGSFTTVDLSALPAPDIIESLDYEAVLADCKTELLQRYPAFSAVVESDPAYKVLEVLAYREMLLRQRINDAARGTMVAFAQKGDLDQIGANYDVSRLVVTPADNSTYPPTPAVYETDDNLRQRIPLSLEGYSTAGSEGSYIFHARSASGHVKDASAVSPTPGVVTVYVLSTVGNGTADEQLLTAVRAALNVQHVRPITDQVFVLSASIVEYLIEAELELFEGPDPVVVLAAAQVATDAYAAKMHKMGVGVSRSGLFQALHRPGVKSVNLIAPATDIALFDGQAAYCTGTAISKAPDDESGVL